MAGKALLSMKMIMKSGIENKLVFHHNNDENSVTRVQHWTDQFPFEMIVKTVSSDSLGQMTSTDLVSTKGKTKVN